MLSQKSSNFSLSPSFSTAIARLSQIFPHRWNFIYKPGAARSWLTESRYPLSDADLWEFHQSDQVTIGVRFGALTQYGLIDIDADSPYHPKANPNAINDIKQSLEKIGIYRSLMVQSSSSRGLHLYLPFDQPIATFVLASTLKQTLETSGFTIASGTLEIFPHPKVYRVDRPSNYNGHRLPLQQGSFLLNADFNPIANDITSFLDSFDIAAKGNDINEFLDAAEKLKKQKVKLKKDTKEVRIGSRGQAWCESLKRSISIGWTGFKQTNELIHKLATYGRVFLRLEGSQLINYCVKTAQSLPGFEQYCRHQRDLLERCTDWAKSVERFYTPYCSQRPGGNPWKEKRKESAHNQSQATDAINRIKDAIARLREEGTLMIGRVRETLQQIARVAGCSLSTLYKHRDLWCAAIEGCNSQKAETEQVSEDKDSQEQKSDNSLKPRRRKLLHPKKYYEGLQLGFFPDRSHFHEFDLPGINSQDRQIAPGSSFSDRGVP